MRPPWCNEPYHFEQYAHECQVIFYAVKTRTSEKGNSEEKTSDTSHKRSKLQRLLIEKQI